MLEFVVAILTVVGSGVVAAVVTSRLNARTNYIVAMRAKAEELYQAIEEYDGSLGSHFYTLFPVLSNEISYNDYLDLRIKNGEKTGKNNFVQLVMLTKIYFPEIEPALDRLIKARDEANRIMGSHKKAYKAGDIDGQRWIGPFTKALKEVEAAADLLKKAVVERAREIAISEGAWPFSERGGVKPTKKATVGGES